MLNRDCEPEGVCFSFDIFMQMLPQDHLIEMVKEIIHKLVAETGNKNDPTTPGKKLKWIGVLVIETHEEFGTCDLLCNAHPRGTSKYPKAPIFLPDWIYAG